jgi:hypothetical protein
MFRAAFEIAIMIETANTSPTSVGQRERTVYGAAPMTGVAGGKATLCGQHSQQGKPHEKGHFQMAQGWGYLEKTSTALPNSDL